ncbi:MAG: hypothetical protein LAT63_08520 [Marinobacter sp.]|nr:hypothetical protein [Marinobacter sp.]
MLKELWRKTLRHPLWPVSGERFNLLTRITHTGQYHLERLLSLMESRYNRRYPRLTDQATRELIRYATRIQDQDIQRELLLFYLNCTPDVQAFLRADDLFGALDALPVQRQNQHSAA